MARRRPREEVQHEEEPLPPDPVELALKEVPSTWPRLEHREEGREVWLLRVPEYISHLVADPHVPAGTELGKIAFDRSNAKRSRTMGRRSVGVAGAEEAGSLGGSAEPAYTLVAQRTEKLRAADEAVVHAVHEALRAAQAGKSAAEKELARARAAAVKHSTDADVIAKMTGLQISYVKRASEALNHAVGAAKLAGELADDGVAPGLAHAMAATLAGGASGGAGSGAGGGIAGVATGVAQADASMFGDLLRSLRVAVAGARKVLVPALPEPDHEQLKQRRLKLLSPPSVEPAAGEDVLKARLKDLEGLVQAAVHMMEELPPTTYNVITAKPNGVRLIRSEAGKEGFALSGVVTRTANVVPGLGLVYDAQLRSRRRVRDRPVEEQTAEYTRTTRPKADTGTQFAAHVRQKAAPGAKAAYSSLIQAFGAQANWRREDLRHVLNIPDAQLSSELQKYCQYVASGPEHGTYALKAEYRIR